MGSESGSISCGGDAEVRQVPPVHTNIVQSLKEVVNNGNYTDSDIYDVLRDCDMDPNAAVQKLLSQGSAELGKASYRRDNGSASPVLPSSSLTYEVKTPVDRPSPHSDSFEDKSASKNIRLVDSSAQSPLASQSDWPGGSSGHVSKADIVRVRGPQTKGIQTSVRTSSYLLPDADYDGLFTKSLNTSLSLPEIDQNAQYSLPLNGSEGTRKSVTLSSENGLDYARPLMERRTGHTSTFNSSSSSGLDRFSTQCYTHNSGSIIFADSSLNAGKAAEDEALKHLGTDFVKSVPVSVTSGMLSSDEVSFFPNPKTGRRAHLASISSSLEILQSAEGLQQLSLEEKPAEVTSENKHGVVFPNYMQAFAADCSHLSFGTYKSMVQPSMSVPAMSDSMQILNSTAYGLPTSYSQEFPGSNLLREPALLQHVTSQPFSQPALSLEEVAKLTGYPALSPNYVHSSSFSLQQHAYEETSFLNLARIKNLNQFKGDGSRSNFPQPDAADVSGYAGFGRQSNYRGKFPRDLSSNLSASAVGYGDTLRSSFTGGNNLSSLQQNDISSPWEYGPDKATLSAIPDNQYHSLHGYSQFLPRYNKQDQQQHSHDYGALGYGSSYPSQGRTVQEQWIGAGSVNSFPDPSSKQQKIWGQNY
ncbi:unnamed protein product [Linum tenue]|uniref:GBF-interacting protein 1 N-terminal domain-containing protein n=1 Tax=Linum tenue TaxID=586396 RepID=A0AAV0MSY1_9ROSI|nr:unnamed protein product [Linum tenue]